MRPATLTTTIVTAKKAIASPLPSSAPYTPMRPASTPATTTTTAATSAVVTTAPRTIRRSLGCIGLPFPGRGAVHTRVWRLARQRRSEEHTSELQSHHDLV